MSAVSIIIATADRLSDLRETLQSLGAVSIPDDFFVEVVLVGKSSRASTEEMLRTLPPYRFAIRYLHEPEAGKSQALNFAITQAKGDILLFTDDDVRFPTGWIVDMCTPLIRGEGSVVVGGARLAPELQRKWMTRYHRGFLASTEYLSPTDPSEFAGINMACTRAVILKVPEFDSEMGPGGVRHADIPPLAHQPEAGAARNRYDVIAGEDSFFGRRLRQAGCTFVSRTNVWVIHHPDKARLLYKSWVRAALPQGRFESYLLHHWHHETIRFVHIRLLYFRLKLRLRMLLNPRRLPDDEGIFPWELSYRVEISRLQHHLQERHRPRNYARHGLRRLDRDSESRRPA